MPKQRELWSGRFGFILSNIGAAIGLGSIWKFPYEVGTNGGGGFILFYVIGLTLIVFPLMLVEFAIGRQGRSDAIGSVAAVAAQNRASRSWGLIGAIGIAASYLVLSFYSVVGGWSLYYVAAIILQGLSDHSAAAAQARFDSMLASPFLMTGCHAAFMSVTAFIVSRGIAHGIESACKILMPILILLIIVLAAYSMIQGDTYSALKFLFAIDPALVTPKVALEAFGLGFFSIGVGMAVMITYGSHADRQIDLREVAIATIVGDTFVSCLAGLAVFPVVFAEKLNPASGPGLTFVTLPLALSRLPFGTPAAAMFFALLAVAAFASAISMLEPPTAFLERRAGYSRPVATLVAAGSCGLVGLLSVLSFNLSDAWHPLATIGFTDATVFDLFDELTSNVLLPIGSFALALFGGWAISSALFVEQLQFGAFGATSLRALLRYVVPLAIGAASIAAVRF